VRTGRQEGKTLGDDYMEVRFENLIAQPEPILSQIGSFVDHNMDYEHICRAGIGSVSQPNTSFGARSKEEFNPVDRWKLMMSSRQTAEFEELVGDCLMELGYSLAFASRNKKTLRAFRMRTTYLPLFAAKLWMRTKTPLGRFVDLDRIEIERSATV